MNPLYTGSATEQHAQRASPPLTCGFLNQSPPFQHYMWNNLMERLLEFVPVLYVCVCICVCVCACTRVLYCDKNKS